MKIPKMSNENRAATQAGLAFVAGSLLTPIITKKNSNVKDFIKYMGLCLLSGAAIGLVGSGVDIHREGDTLKVHIDTLYDLPYKKT